MKNYIPLVVLCLSLTGCVTSPRPVSQTRQNLINLDESKIDQTLIKGKTTKQDVKKIFGEPFGSDVVDSHSTKWIYLTIDAKLQDGNVPLFAERKYDNNIIQLTILFENDIVSNYEYSKKYKSSNYDLSFAFN